MNLSLVLLAAAAFVSTVFGGILILRNRRNLHYFFAFSAGSIITLAFIDLLPESIDVAARVGISARAVLGVTVGSFFLYSLIDRFFLTHHLHEDDQHGHPMGLVGAGSLIVHSFLDGAAIAIAFQSSPSIGVIVAAAVIVHDVTDGLNTVALMLKNHHSPQRARQFLILDALAPTAGILFASLFILPLASLAYVLAFFAGEFLYIGTGSLLPETQGHPSAGMTAAMGMGVALVALMTVFL